MGLWRKLLLLGYRKQSLMLVLLPMELILPKWKIWVDGNRMLLLMTLL
jgi:hypothetical protein